MCPSIRRTAAAGVVTLAFLSCESATQPEPQLSVSVTGQGRITSSPSGVDCTAGQSGTCSSAFPTGTAVTLTATADSGWEFGSWSGACVGEGECVVTLDVSSSVSAAFFAQPTLTVSIEGQGRVISSPPGIARTDPFPRAGSLSPIPVMGGFNFSTVVTGPSTRAGWTPTGWPTAGVKTMRVSSATAVRMTA